MKLYEHTGDGHYIGSTIIVWAGSKKTAKEMIRKILNSNGLNNEKIDVLGITELENKSKVIYVNDGDY